MENKTRNRQIKKKARRKQEKPSQCNMENKTINSQPKMIEENDNRELVNVMYEKQNT